MRTLGIFFGAIAFMFTGAILLAIVAGVAVVCKGIGRVRGLDRDDDHHWEDCAMNHGGSECDMGTACGEPDPGIDVDAEPINADGTPLGITGLRDTIAEFDPRPEVPRCQHCGRPLDAYGICPDL